MKLTYHVGAVEKSTAGAAAKSRSTDRVHESYARTPPPPTAVLMSFLCYKLQVQQPTTAATTEHKNDVLVVA